MRYWFSEKSSEIIGAFIGCAAFLLLVAWEERRAVGVFLGAVVALYALTGCTSGKALIDACRDGLCR